MTRFYPVSKRKAATKPKEGGRLRQGHTAQQGLCWEWRIEDTERTLKWLGRGHKFQPGKLRLRCWGGGALTPQQPREALCTDREAEGQGSTTCTGRSPMKAKALDAPRPRPMACLALCSRDTDAQRIRPEAHGTGCKGVRRPCGTGLGLPSSIWCLRGQPASCLGPEEQAAAPSGLPARICLSPS